jgi:prepilin-type N-terminal cleavage/methylation domain-containing protein
MKGFTLIELLIVLAILVIVGVLSVPFFQSFQVSSDLNTYTQTISQALQKVQQQALAGQNNLAWGVYFDESNKRIVLYQGIDYSSRNQLYDFEMGYPSIFTLVTSFGNDINFASQTGIPSVNGNITITSRNNETRIINISSIGLIQIND